MANEDKKPLFNTTEEDGPNGRITVHSIEFDDGPIEATMRVGGRILESIIGALAYVLSRLLFLIAWVVLCAGLGIAALFYVSDRIEEPRECIEHHTVDGEPVCTEWG